MNLSAFSNQNLDHTGMAGFQLGLSYFPDCAPDISTANSISPPLCRGGCVEGPLAWVHAGRAGVGEASDVFPRPKLSGTQVAHACAETGA